MREPSLLVPYKGPDPSGNTFDVYVYLRPETNGVLSESVLMKTVLAEPEWAEKVKLVYLANYPGDFIQTRHLIEHHYRTQLFFARQGASAFTPGMIKVFEDTFSVDFTKEKRKGHILGAFESLETLGMSEEELFAYRVEESEMVEILGQNIKRRGDYWIVNYDIPALLQKNDFDTDIAVMVFRVALRWDVFRILVKAMGTHLAEAGAISPHTPASRAFHHSKSPWEQLLDGIDYLWGVDVSDGGAEDDISFGAYMMNHGYSRKSLKQIIRRPLVEYRSEPDSPEITREGNIFELSAGMTYKEAHQMLEQVIRPLDFHVKHKPDS